MSAQTGDCAPLCFAAPHSQILPGASRPFLRLEPSALGSLPIINLPMNLPMNLPTVPTYVPGQSGSACPCDVTLAAARRVCPFQLILVIGNHLFLLLLSQTSYCRRLFSCSDRPAPKALQAAPDPPTTVAALCQSPSAADQVLADSRGHYTSVQRVQSVLACLRDIAFGSWSPTGPHSD